jgi:hypothetical protein
MEIHGQVGIVIGVETEQGPRFRSIQLHLIPVQVQAHGIRSLSHPFHGPVLSPAVRRTHPLIPVRVVKGSDKKDQGVGPMAVFSGRQLPEEDEKALLPRDLSGMDATLDIDPGLPAG